MATTTVQDNNKLIKFQRQILREFVRENLFSPYYGTGLNAIFRNVHETKEAGEQINIPLVERLSQAAIGSGTLVGNEEAIDNYGFRVWLDWARNAVTTNKRQKHLDSADVFGEAKPLLSDWGKELQRDELILALHSLPSASPPTGLGGSAGRRVNGILYSAASTANKNAWNAANTDRVLFGDAIGNYSGTHATALGAITGAMSLSAEIVSLMKRMAKNASPAIRPYRITEGGSREYFVLFCNSFQFRDLKEDLNTINSDARERNVEKNPIFQDGDLIYDGVIVREVPEMGSLTTVAGAGDSSIDVAPAFLCGQQAAAIAWGQEPKPTFRREDDYQFIVGTGVEMAYGIAKMAKVPKAGGGLKDWGVFTWYGPSVADA
jgi:N4-gp56 family major capsid protein